MIPAHPRTAAKLFGCSINSGLTRVDLLATLAALVVLCPLVFGALSSAELKARQTECLTKIRRLTLSASGYMDENKKPLPYENPKYPGGTWMGTLTERLDNETSMLCPNAPARQPVPAKGNRRGSSDQAWIRWTEDGKKMFAGSYGYNAWLYSDPLYLEKYFPRSKDQALVFTNTASIQKPALTPVFVDANWVDLLPKETDERWFDQATGAPFGSPRDNHMGRCSIARHGDLDPSLAPHDLGPDEKMTGAVSLGFVDGHAEISALEQLWTYSWHRDWKPSANPPE